MSKLAKQNGYSAEQLATELGCTTDQAAAAIRDLGPVDTASLDLVREYLKEIETTEATASHPSAIERLDSTQLPQVASLSNTQVDAYIAQIEQMDNDGQTVSDGLVEFLCQLYDRRQAAIELAVGAAQRFRQQDVQLNQAMEQLDQVLNNSVGALQQSHQVLSKIADGGSRLGHNFRTAQKGWQSAADRFYSHTAQSA